MPILKFVSRKFLVTLGAILALVSTEDTSLRLWIIAGVAAVYVITEGVLDARGMPAVAHDIGEAIKAGIEKGQALVATPGPAAPLPTEPSPPTPLPTGSASAAPATPTLLPSLPEDSRP